MIIGIDFGTCFSNVAIMRGNIPSVTYIDQYKQNDLGIPSLIRCDDGDFLYGLECLAYNDDNNIKDLKSQIRQFGTGRKVEFRNNRQFSLKEIAEKYIGYLIDIIQKAARDSGEFDNIEIEEVTITAPVGIANKQLSATLYVEMLSDILANITGLQKNKIHILHEPVAAAISYLNSTANKENNQTILVFDLGGGTLDVSVVEYDRNNDSILGQYSVKAKNGDLNLGGNDWDDRLAHLVLQKAALEEELSEEEQIDFAESIRELKHKLSKNVCDAVVFKAGKNYKTIFVDRGEFEAATKELLEQAKKLTRKTVDAYMNNGGKQINKIILVGGSSKMPQIIDGIRNQFKEIASQNIIVHDPSNAICKGAGIFAKIHSYVTDTAPHTYGFKARNSTTGQKEIYNLLFRGDKFDESGFIRKRSKTVFFPTEDDQTEVYFKAYESDAALTDCRDNWLEFSNGERSNGIEVKLPIPENCLGHARQFKLYPEFVLDYNGILVLNIYNQHGELIGTGKTCCDVDIQNIDN